MNSPASQDPESATPVTAEHEVALPDSHSDPITGEPGAHPVGVGVGALSAGAVGAAIGAFAGPVGVVIGAAIGAIAGGLAGKDVAESPEISPTAEEGEPLDEFDHTATGLAPDERPLPSAVIEHTNPTSDASFIVGSGSEGEPALDEFDRPHVAAIPVLATSHRDSAKVGDRPLPTASTGLVTPDEDSFFADSTTGESSMVTESPLPAMLAVSPGDHFADTETTASPSGPASEGFEDQEPAVRFAAYYRYLDRQTSGAPGSDLDDWIKAEQEVFHRSARLYPIWKQERVGKQ